MPRVTFTANLQRHLPCPSVEAEGGTVRDVLDAAFEANPQLRSYILDEQGRLRKHVNVFLKGGAVADRNGLSDPVDPRDEIYVLQALSGG